MNKKLIHTLFEREALRVPDKIAVQEEDKNISFDELNCSSNKLAYTLLKLGVKQDAVVAVVMPPSIDLVRSLLAIFKAGGIYLPLDLAFSANRLSQIITQCEAQILIIKEENKNQVTSILSDLGLKVKYLITIDSDHNFKVCLNQGFTYNQVELEAAESVENPQVEIDGKDSNYIFYTSGSTGEAKGILGKHESLSQFIHWEIKEFGIDETYRISQLAQITFDASLRDIFLPLSVGGTLFIPSLDTKNNVVKLIQWIDENEISLIHCVPSLFKLISKELKNFQNSNAKFPSLKHLLMAGEALYSKDILSWREVAIM
jgi:mycobactin peptide synthetase MbtE